MSREIEREWTDQFGTHWEVQVQGADGAIHSQKLTKTRFGWPSRDEARAAVRRQALAAFQSRQEGK